MSWVGFAIGVGLALFTWATVMNTLVFTRGPVPLVERGVILGLRRVYVWAAPRIRRYERRDNFLATLAPLALLMHLACWLTLFFVAYALMLWPFVDGGLSEGLRASGSSLFTLGVSGPGGPAPTALILVTATTGIVVIALYIAYLPTLYGQVNSRETKVSRLESLSGAPPWGPRLLASHQEYGLIDALPSLYERWDQMVAEISVSISHYPLLAWFRGPNPQTSFITSVLAVLDSAALYSAVAPSSAPIECRAFVRTGSHAFKKVSETMGFAADFTQLDAQDPGLTYDEFLEGLERLRSSGFPMAVGPEEAWHSFRAQRSGYATRTRILADLVLAPPAPWSGSGGESRPLKGPAQARG